MPVQPDKKEIGWVVLLLIIVLVSFFFKSVFLGEVLIPSDNVFYGDKFWETYKPVNYQNHSKNWHILDQTYSFIPWRIYATQSIHKGILPLWDPYNSCGKPFIGNLQSALFDPINFFAIFCFPIFQQTIFIAISRLFIAGLGTYLFCRSIGLSTTASFFSALSFIFCGFMVPWLGHPQAGVACWLPFLFLFIEKMVSNPSFRTFALFSITIGFQFLAGHIETSLHILATITLFFIVRTLQRFHTLKNVKEIFILLSSYTLAGIIGFLFAGIQLIPFLEYLVQSSQYSERTQLHYPLDVPFILGNWHDFLLKVGTFITFIFPAIFRYPNDITSWYPNQDVLLHNFYIGIIPFLLVTFSFFLFFSKSRTWIIKKHLTTMVFFFSLLFLTLGISLWLPFFNIINLLPIFRYAVNERFSLIVCFSGSILAGFGWNTLFYHPDSESNLREYTISFCRNLGIIIILFIPLILILSNNWSFLHPHRISIDRSMIFPTILIFLFLLITTGFITDRIKLRYSHHSLLGLTIIEMFYFGININPTVLLQDIYPSVEPIRFLQNNLQDERVAGVGWIFMPEVNKIFGIQDIRGYDPMRVKSYDSWLGKRFDKVALWGSLVLINSTNPFALDLLGVKYLITDIQTPVPDHRGFVVAYQNKVIKIYENINRLPHAFIVNYSDLEMQNNELGKNINILQFKNIVSSGTTATIETYEPNLVMLKTHSSQSGYLFLSDTYFPGWKASIDNHPIPIYRAMDTFRAVEVPSGNHEVVFEYRPLSFTLGWIISLLTAAILGIGYILLKDKHL